MRQTTAVELFAQRLYLFAIATVCLVGCEKPFANRIEPSRQEPYSAFKSGAVAASVAASGEQLSFSFLGAIWVVDASGGEAEQVTSGWGRDGLSRVPPSIPSEIIDKGNKLIFVRNSRTGRELRLVDLHTKAESVLWSTDGHLVCSNENRNECAYTGPVRDFVTSSDGDVVYVSTGTHLVEIDRTTGRVRVICDCRIRFFDISPDGNSIIHDGPATLPVSIQREASFASQLDLQTREQNPLIIDFEGSITSLQYSKSGEYIFFVRRSAGEECIVKLYVMSGSQTNLVCDYARNMSIATHPSGGRLIVTKDGQIFEFELSTQSFRRIPFTTNLRRAEAKLETIVIKGGTLFSGVGDQPHLCERILIVGQNIDQLDCDGSSEQALTAETVIDAAGLFIMPGLIDSHAHLSYQDIERLGSLIFEGVTTVIDPATWYPNTLVQEDLIDLGIKVGPRIIRMSDAIDGGDEQVSLRAYLGRVSDPEVIRSIVRRYAALGYDGIKIYENLDPDVVRAAGKEALQQKMLVWGHLGRTSWEEAVDFGVNVISHVNLFPYCSSSSDWPEDRDDAVPDWECLSKLFQLMAEKDVTLDPTLVKVTPEVWPAQRFDRLKAQLDDLSSEQFEIHVEVIDLARHSGVNLIIGRDNWDWDYAYELEAYDRAGVPRSDILKMATANAARAIGRDGEFGTIEKGKTADIIIVDGEPLERIGDLRNVFMVIKEGEIVVDRLSTAVH